MTEISDKALSSTTTDQFCEYSNAAVGLPPNYEILSKSEASKQKRIQKDHWICDYADDIYQTLRETELRRSIVFFRSQQCRFRPSLLRLLKMAAEQHGLSRITLHFAVYLLDCFMDNYTVRPDKLNLASITCLIIAAKIEEADMDTPRFADLNKLVGEMYTLFEFKNVEFKMLSTFNFDLIRPTAATFVEYFANTFITLEEFHVYVNNWYNGTLNLVNTEASQKSLPKLYKSYEEMITLLGDVLFELVDVSLNYMKFVNARPSIIAAACIAAVRSLNHITPIWTSYLERATECTADVIEPFVEAMLTLYEIHKKKQHVAQMSPGKAIVSSVLCDSPDSGITSIGHSKSDISDVEDNGVDDGNNDDDEYEEEEDEDEYCCTEYPILAKRRRIY